MIPTTPHSTTTSRLSTRPALRARRLDEDDDIDIPEFCEPAFTGERLFLGAVAGVYLAFVGTFGWVIFGP